jgi:hypothetical protein
MSSLVRGALDDVRDLFREEMALARAEFRLEMSRATSAAARFGAAAASGWLAGMFILTAMALGIAEGAGWPAWTGFAIVGVLLGIVAGMLYANGRSALRKVQGMPRTVETVKEIKETFQ